MATFQNLTGAAWAPFAVTDNLPSFMADKSIPQWTFSNQ